MHVTKFFKIAKKSNQKDDPLKTIEGVRKVRQNIENRTEEVFKQYAISRRNCYHLSKQIYLDSYN